MKRKVVILIITITIIAIAFAGCVRRGNNNRPTVEPPKTGIETKPTGEYSGYQVGY